MKIKLITIGLLSTSIGFAQNTAKLIDSIAKVHFSDSTNVGLSVGVINDTIKETYFYGGKYTPHKYDIDNNTLFEIGSISKVFTSFILAKMENEGVVSRFDLISEYLPSDVSKSNSWASKIRLVDLSTHTSGLPSYDNTKSLQELKGFDENNPYGIFTEGFMLSILKNLNSVKEYGSIRYSNFGVGLLGHILANTKNMTYEKLFHEYIIKDLALSSTYYKIGEEQLTRMAIPHRGTESMPIIQLAALSPSGGIKTSMPDLLDYLELHLKKPKNHEKVVEAVLSNQLGDNEQQMALGWVPYQIDGIPIFFHTGGTYGSSSIVIIIPSKHSAVAILSNNQLNGELTTYALSIVDLLLSTS